MKRINYLILSLVFAAAVSAPAFSQDKPGEEPKDEPKAGRDQPVDARGRMLRQLGLSREQLQRLMRVNRERKPIMDAAQARLRAATKALDDAIYADQLNEVEVQARLKDMQLAQAEVFRIRFMNEIAVRRLLTQEQLVRFRNMRQRFERMQERNNSAPAMARDARSTEAAPVKPM